MRIYFFLFCCWMMPQIIFANIFALSQYHRFGPLSNRTQNPIYLLFLDESMERGSAFLKKNEWNLSLETTFSNIFEIDFYNSNNEKIDIDNELWRTSVKLAFAPSNQMSLGLEIPFFSFSAGFLDGFVQNFHQTFGFPNGGRDWIAHYRLAYEIQKGKTRYQPKPAVFGLGDIIFWNKLQILQESVLAPAISLKASFKFPTGSPQYATGSGAPDLAFSIYLEKSYQRIHSYSHLGFIVMGGTKDLNPILNAGQISFGQALEINIGEYISFITQLKGNTPIFSNMKSTEFSWPILDFSNGFAGQIPISNSNMKLHYEFAFVEDILFGGPSVDFSVFFKTGLIF